MTQIKDIFDDYSAKNVGTTISIELEVATEDARAIRKKYA